MTKKIGLALGGGAGLGWAHIGVINCLSDHNIHPDYIAGTSIGAIVGACLAAGKMKEVELVARKMTVKELLALGQFGFRKGAFLGTEKIERELRGHLGEMNFDSLETSFSAIAADLYTSERVELTEGDVVSAVLASAAVPGVFPPVKLGENTLIDGGVVDPLPCESLHRMGAEYIIAVDLQGDYTGRLSKLGLTKETPVRAKAMKTARASLFIMMKQIGQERLQRFPADLVITPKVGHVEMADFTKAEELIQLGYEETEKQIFSLIKIAAE
ncbi:patatin-like phospholipase family protein [Temperatibacter marinus]|uniref:Patatin-like phospholipase family protein n=1 Tax=Temperatibacter marinus TaxID=1456591 RepID=A0AA52EHB3_9PROT|nr:patatin-like phospholipase family protein [Temperatibacter marinus]WND02309.1 patatin-like phospholipase family protein [Temperatibacter marinus]